MRSDTTENYFSHTKFVLKIRRLEGITIAERIAQEKLWNARESSNKLSDNFMPLRLLAVSGYLLSI